jgi:small subunit ribosomal protein S20
MPIIKSAKKRVKVAAKANIRNAKTKRTMREALKAFSKAAASGNVKKIEEAQNAAMSAIDRAAKKAVIHKNVAARKKAQLSASAKKSGVKPTKSSLKKVSPASKPAPKKPIAKKTATKKSPVKKPSTKK